MYNKIIDVAIGVTNGEYITPGFLATSPRWNSIPSHSYNVVGIPIYTTEWRESMLS